MRMAEAFRWLGFAAMLLLLTSCGGSENPLSDPLQAKPDAQLLGIWRRNDVNGVEYYHVGRAGGQLPPGIMRAFSISHKQDGTLTGVSVKHAFSSIIGEKPYLNFIITKDEKHWSQLYSKGWQPDLIRFYCLVKYEVKGDTLDIWVMDPKAQLRLVQSGKIKGAVNENVKDDVIFTDTPENLAALMASPESEELFKKEPSLRYERVK